MKVLFLNPPFKGDCGRYSRSSRSPAITKSGTLYYPIWLCYAAAVVRGDGFEIDVVDSCAYEIDLDQTIRRVKEFNPGLIIIDTSTPSIYEDVKTAGLIKEAMPNSIVALMGTHPTALPRETLLIDPRVDVVIVGEADFTVRDLARVCRDSLLERLCRDPEYRREKLLSVEGLVFTCGGRVEMSSPRKLIPNLDVIPFVSPIYKEFLDPNRYFFAASDYPMVHILGSRGCVAKCTFCVYPQVMHGGKYRNRSPENIATEVQWICENIPQVREIGFEDDTFTGNQKDVIAFCQLLVQRGVKIKWYCNARADLEFGTMQWMKRAGCQLLIVGYESSSREVLKNIHKRMTPDRMLEFSKDARRAGLLVHGCFMVGNCGDTRATIEETLRFSLKLGDDTVQFFPLITYPGTLAYKWAQENGRLAISDYDEYLTSDGMHNSVVSMPDMSTDGLRRWCDAARKKYYLRPSYIAYKLISIFKNPSEIRRTARAFIKFAKHLMG